MLTYTQSAFGALEEEKIQVTEQLRDRENKIQNLEVVLNKKLGESTVTYILQNMANPELRHPLVGELGSDVVDHMLYIRNNIQYALLNKGALPEYDKFSLRAQAYHARSQVAETFMNLLRETFEKYEDSVKPLMQTSSLNSWLEDLKNIVAPEALVREGAASNFKIKVIDAINIKDKNKAMTDLARATIHALKLSANVNERKAQWFSEKVTKVSRIVSRISGLFADQPEEQVRLIENLKNTDPNSITVSSVSGILTIIAEQCGGDKTDALREALDILFGSRHKKRRAAQEQINGWVKELEDLYATTDTVAIVQRKAENLKEKQSHWGQWVTRIFEHNEVMRRNRRNLLETQEMLVDKLNWKAVTIEAVQNSSNWEEFLEHYNRLLSAE